MTKDFGKRKKLWGQVTHLKATETFSQKRLLVCFRVVSLVENKTCKKKYYQYLLNFLFNYPVLNFEEKFVD